VPAVELSFGSLRLLRRGDTGDDRLPAPAVGFNSPLTAAAAPPSDGGGLEAGDRRR